MYDECIDQINQTNYCGEGLTHPLIAIIPLFVIACLLLLISFKEE